jgi:H+/Cl- antiporter ClcA
VRISASIDMLSEHAPSIEVFTLCAALFGAWLGVPEWLPIGLAIIVGSLALLLFAARGRKGRRLGEPDDEPGRNWIQYEIAGKGTPPGAYILAFFGFVTVVLTGFQSAYAMPAWAGLVLGIVWGIANRSYPADEEADA